MTTSPLYGMVTLGVGGRTWSCGDEPVGLITTFVEFYPGEFVSLHIEHGVTHRALLARRELCSLLLPVRSTRYTYNAQLVGQF
jgi:hypothetical protein